MTWFLPFTKEEARRGSALRRINLMTQFLNKLTEKEKRRRLRKNTTAFEKIIWTYLRRKQILNERFLRQFSIEYFVLDFYCPRLRLAIEIDGSSHFITQDAIDYDMERQKYIEKLGIEFLRFRNEEVFYDNGKGFVEIGRRN